MIEYGASWMAGTSSRFQVKVTQFTQTLGTWERCLAADPRRWYVRFQIMAVPPAVAWVMPGGVQAFANPGGDTNLPLEFKWKDSPAAVTGEWYCAMGVGNPLTIIEELYVGG